MVRPTTTEINVRVHGPREPGDVPERCAVLLDLLSRDERGDPIGAHERPVFILQQASHTVDALCRLALGAGFILRVDLPPDTDVPGTWPVTMRSVAGLDPVLRQLMRHARHELLYPASVWGIARDAEAATQQAIEGFQRDRMNGALFDAVLTLHGFRIALWPSSVDVTVACADLDRTVQWVRRALEETGPVAFWDQD
jgi:hypothetical protein